MRFWPRKKVYLDNLPRTHDVRFGLLFLAGFVVLVGAIYAVGYVTAGNTVPRGTRVADVDIGSLSRGEARTTLEEELLPRLQQPITVTGRSERFVVDPQDAGITLDVHATVDDAMEGADWDPRHMLAVLLGGGDVDPVLQVDPDDFAEVTEPMVERVAVPPTNSSVTFVGGVPLVRYGSTGETVDLAALRTRLVEAITADEDVVRLPMKEVAPDVTSREADRFVADVAAPAVDGSVTLRAGSTNLVVPPEQFATALRADRDGQGLALGIDEAAAFQLGAASRAELPGQTRNARVVFEDTHPVVLPARPGVAISPPDWAASVLQAVQRPRRSAQVRVHEAAPAFSTADAKALRITRRVAVQEVSFPASVGLADVVRAARQLDNAVIRPGASLSFLERVQLRERPAAARVVASATFDTALAAGLHVVERAASLHAVDYLPEGRDALVVRGRHDLVLENDGPYGVLLHVTVVPGFDGGTVRVAAWSSAYWDVSVRTSSQYDVVVPAVQEDAGPGCQPSEGQSGFSVDVTQARVGAAGQDEDIFTSSYAPVSEVVCVNSPGPGGAGPGGP
jgi:hypothetical protein